jgi:DNA-binding CsgD family transcriptional regulator
LPQALAAREQGHRLEEIARVLNDHLDLSAAEREILQKMSPP